MNFEEDEINLILKALRYTVECGYEHTMSQEEVEEYQAMRHLIRLLDPQPVKKEGWMVVWNRGNTSSVFSTEEEAKEWYGYPKVCEGKVVKVTWEE